MKVLVISRNAWDDTNSIGNTLTNFFENLDDIEFANIYFRSARPNNHICKYYYRTSETEVLKNWFSPNKIGKRFCMSNNENSDSQDFSANKEKNLVRAIQKYGLSFAYKLSDYIWYSGKWINENLKDFIESFSPDIVFSFVKYAPQYYLTIKYLRANYNIPLLTWIADDEYTGLLKSNSFKEIENLKYILSESAVVRGCSEEICEYYNSIFDCQATPLYKSCDLSAPIKEAVSDPVKIVYAGNLLYGRLELLREVAEVLDEYALERRQVSFEIYSNTSLSPEEQTYFNQKSSTAYMGRKAYETIKRRLEAADVVLHVESFDEAQILKTKYSFSTKIIDCLQSGSVLLGVGPAEIASIKYICRIPGACVIDGLQQLRTGLFAFLDDTEHFGYRAEAIRDFARKHHDAAVQSVRLQQSMMDIIKGRM